MCVYHFSASGYKQGADEFCANDVDAEHTAFRICMELSASSDRLILITVTNAAGSEIARVPRLSTAELSYLSREKR
jgi:hypothetical protein